MDKLKEKLLIDCEEYIFDVSEIIKTISKESNFKPVQKEIIDSYDTDEDGDLMVSQKVIRELSDNTGTYYDASKYELIINFINVVSNIECGDTEKLTIGEKIVLNTLIENKILKKIDKNEKRKRD